MATKTLGFKLKVLGNQETVSEVQKVNKALTEVQLSIKQINSQKINLNTNFDTKSINELIKILDKVKTTKISPDAINQIKELQTQLKSLQAELKSAQTQLANIKAPTLSGEQLDQVNGKLVKMNGHAKEAVNGIEKLKPAFSNVGTKEANELAESLAKIQINLDKVRNQKLTIKSDKTVTDSAKNSLLAPLIEQEKILQAQQKLLTRDIDLATKAFVNQNNNIPKDSIIGLQTELSKLTLEYNKLSKAELETNKGQTLQKNIANISNEITAREQAVGNFRRNVGNYKSALTGLIPELQNLQKAGILAEKDLIGIFKSDLISRANTLESEIKDLGVQFTALGNSIEKAGERSAILTKIDDRARELGNVKGAIDQSTQSFDRLGGKLLRVSDVITGGLIGGGILATIGALKSFGASAITEFTQAETALAKINQQLIVTGNASGKSAEALQQTAKELEALTGIDGDQILNDVTSSLLKFGAVQGDVFDRAQKAAIDLSATLGGDLKGAADLVGKALEDPEKGITRLARAGVILDKETQAAVKNALKSNDVYKAQTIVLDSLEKKFKGVSEAVQNSDLKNLRQFTVDWNNFKESVGKGLIQAFNGITTVLREFGNGTIFAAAGTKETKAAVIQLTSTLSRENEVIKNSFNALRDDTISREEKTVIIKNLIAKYPEYLSNLDLEKASYNDLIKIQDQLTETVKKRTFERILARAQEAAQAAEDTERLRLAFLRSRDLENLSFGDRFTIGLQGDSQSSQSAAIDRLTKDSEARLKKYKDQTSKITSELKASLEKEFGAIDETKTLAIQSIKSGIKGAGEASDEALKTLDEQIKRIKDIQNQVKDLKVESIDNEFDKQIEKVKLSTGKQIDEIQEKLNSLELKPIKTTLDKSEIVASKELITALRAAENKEIDQINNNRDRSLNEATQKLIDTKKEIDKVISEINNTEIDIHVNEVNFGLQQATRDIEIKFKTNIRELQQNLQAGLISQEQFDVASANLESSKFNAISKLYDENRTEYFKLLQDKQKAEIASVQSIAQIERNAKFTALDLRAEQIADELKAGKIKTAEEANKLLVQAETQAALDIEKITTDSAKRIQEIKQKTTESEQQFIDQGVVAHEAEENKKVEITRKQAEQIKAIILSLSGLSININVNTGIDPDKLRQIKDAALQVSQELSDAIFDIENSQSERAAKERIDFISEEYDNRIKLAKGNTAEIERLEREKDQKIKAIERQENERKKSAAVTQAIINGSLAIIKAFAELGPIAGPIAAITIGLLTAIQINKIKSQKFAKGGYAKRAGGYTGGSQAPPDETGERPVNAVLHYDEWVGSRPMVSKHKALFKILDRNNSKIQSGQGSSLDYDIIDYAEKLKRGIYSPRPNQMRHYEPVIPIIIPMGGNQKNNKIEFTEDHIEMFADILSKRIAEKTGSAVYEGSSKGISDKSKHEARELKRQFKAAV